jgi:hypothetical protein
LLVRAGLFVAGAAVAIIGAGVLVAALTFATGPTVTQFDPVTVASLPGHSSYSPELDGVNQSSATTHVVWASSQSLLVTIYSAVPCPQNKGVCPSSQAMQSWWDNSGSWSATGSLSFPLFLNITNPNATPVTFSGSLVETYTTSALSNPTWALFLPLIGAIVLIAIGGVGIFLGMFLPQGVYSGAGRGGPGYDDLGEDDLGDDDEVDPLGEDEPPPGGHS